MEHDGAEPAAAAAKSRHRSKRERFVGRPVEERAEALKERVYATFTGLAIVLVQHANAEHLSAQQATLALLVGIVGITAAGFVADVVSFLAVHAAFPEGAEFRRMLRVSGEAVASASVPLILLVLAWVDVIELATALRAASIVYVATLAAIGYLAVRRTRLRWWQQGIALVILVGLGFAVIALQQLAHAH
ncbi:hypothetical protein BJY17_002728 [Agromyces hippuratus]|uniref:VIT family protein n=1 Tax=Agromyces hippuratus TaxID=286438 RepID=A0A852X7N8_9MICO|nr:hypothetical protein [Agromyces hippuratus]NYG21981.1 hypothetical protein [Agromyces hippuratus]